MIQRIREGEERSGDDPLQIGPDAFMDLEEPGLIFNHSCRPNAVFKGRSDLVAFREIKSGEEICYDYSATVPSENDWVMSIACRCSSKKCRGMIGNWKTIPPEEMKSYFDAGYLQDFIRQDYEAYCVS